MLHDSKYRVLVLAPHYDDEIIGCSGSLLKYRKSISNLTIAHMIKSDERESEFKKVSEILNPDKHYIFNLEDGFLEQCYKQAVLELIEVIQKDKPDIILMPHENDNHRDHKTTYRIGLDAIEKARYWNRKKDEHKVSHIVLYEVWSFMENVSAIVDITDYIKIKKKLMGYYESQLSFPYMEYVNTINGYRGLLHNRYGKAEAFRVISI